MMRIANISHRLTLVTEEMGLDVERVSAGRFAPHPHAIYSRWAEFVEWAATIEVATHSESTPIDRSKLLAPSPQPRQVIGVGLNYADHAAEPGLPIPTDPVVFTKFASSVAGPDARVRLTGDTVDWEAELVVVIGEGGRNIPAHEAASKVAGLTVGQDLSDRTVQWQGSPAQFSMGKSFENFAPTGPVLVSLDEFDDYNRLAISATITEADGTMIPVQEGSTDQLIFPLEELVSRLSQTIELLPGDLIFTGTPPGVGMAMNPQRYLRAGESLTTEIVRIEVPDLLEWFDSHSDRSRTVGQVP